MNRILINFSRRDGRIQNWENLGIAAMISLYVAQIAMEINRLFWFMGADFMAYWSAGYIINHGSFVDIYNFAKLEHTQHLMLFGKILPNVFFPPLPMAYLPIFVLPFRFFALLPPKFSFLLWTFLNLCLGVGYLVFLIKNSQHPQKRRYLLFFILLFPFFQTLFWGQVNLWLLLFVGEFLRAFQAGRDLRAGLWLSALLLKPQTLLIIVPSLLVAKKLKTLAGVLIGASVIFIASFLVAGEDFLRSLIGLWGGYVHNIATSGVEAMTNWRMVAEVLNHVAPSHFWIYMAIFLSVLFFCWALYLWTLYQSTKTPYFVLLAFSTTMLVAWHSHAHMAVILIPAILSLLLERQFPERVFKLWVFLPPLFYFLGLFLLVFVKDRFYAGVLYGPAQLIFNLIFIFWTSKKILAFSRQPKAHG